MIRLKYISLFYQVRRSLSHGINSAGKVASKLEGQDRSINHSNIFSTVNPKLSVDNTTFIPRQHAGSANRVEI